ncbi:MAG TPA: competence type IV pilus major pilin ComGC [Candidatus Dormibacteraeota bacterium]|nr:competence type IV pilus major pilin ComGC [Candidatus Dormibacteraeota bacterium]
MLKKEAGFTLIEMLIVLLIISVLIILIVPNLSKSSKGIDEQGCEALISVVQAQVNLYYLENRVYPTTLQQLVDDGYLAEEQTKCSNGESLVINDEHHVERQ